MSPIDIGDPVPSGLLGGMVAIEWQVWLSRSERQFLGAGEELFHEGELGDAVYLVVEGHLQISVKRSDGSDVVLAAAQRGDLIGEHYLFAAHAAGRRGSSVQASRSSHLLRWDGPVFMELVQGQAGLAERLRNRTAERESGNLARRGKILQLLSGMQAIDPTEMVRLAAGASIFEEGDEGDAAYVVVAGVVDILRANDNGRVLMQAGVGQCFGERALLTLDRRHAGARAQTDVVLLRLQRQRFLDLHRGSSEFRALIEGVDFVYRLPRRGLAITYAAEHDGLPSIERLYRLDNGRRVRSTWVPESKVFVLRELDGGQEARSKVLRTVRWPADERSEAGEGGNPRDDTSPLNTSGFSRSLLLGDHGRLLGLDSAGEWSDLPWLVERVADGDRLSTREEEIFAATGRVRRPPDDAGVDAEQAVVCRCLGLSAGQLKAKIAAGCSELSSLQSNTGCGTVCGGCVPALKSLLGHGEWIPVQLVTMGRREGQDVQAYRLVPDWPLPTPWRTGQHIVVSGRIEGHWIARSYTLTAPPAPDATPEIAVKRERLGHFSRWLLDGDPMLKEVRIGVPRGEAVWTPNVVDTVCFVAGIGVTPALAIVRSAMQAHAEGGKPSSIHVDYTGRDIASMAFADELQSAAASLPGLSLRLRQSTTEGRLSGADVAQLVKSHPLARYFVCGPIPYMDAVVQALQSAGVPHAAIHEERFAHAGAPLHAAAGEPAARRPGFIRRAYQAAFALAALLVVLVNLPGALGWWPTGHPTPGHEDVACEDCHRRAPGSTRQQLQAKVRHLLGLRVQDAAWLHLPVGNAECTACHDRPKDVHAPYLFMEARYAPVRASLGPEYCASCHREHRDRRVTLPDGEFCSDCHAQMSLKTDALAPPASPTHATLTREGRWSTCMGCHDYHGNHERLTPKRLDEALSPSVIQAGLRGGASPWGKSKKVTAQAHVGPATPTQHGSKEVRP